MIHSKVHPFLEEQKENLRQFHYDIEKIELEKSDPKCFGYGRFKC